ncbi:MAG: hypothetical protein ACO1N2_00970 [Candidatus Saccharimonadota bacterium]
MMPREAEGVLGVWFFNLVNFLDREAGKPNDNIGTLQREREKITA